MGRQEDAHEYARCLIDRLHEDGLKRVSPKPSPAEAETGLTSQIFGLRLRSRIRCSKCEYASNTFEPAMDLSLEVLRANSLEKALASFTAPEKLDGRGIAKGAGVVLGERASSTGRQQRRRRCARPAFDRSPIGYSGAHVPRSITHTGRSEARGQL